MLCHNRLLAQVLLIEPGAELLLLHLQVLVLLKELIVQKILLMQCLALQFLCRHLEGQISQMHLLSVDRIRGSPRGHTALGMRPVSSISISLASARRLWLRGLKVDWA